VVDPTNGLARASAYVDIRTTRKLGNLLPGEVVARVYVSDEDGSPSRLRSGLLAAMLKTLNTLEDPSIR
jgi:hypothetical protein